jgi:spore maturation protein CgeB
VSGHLEANLRALAARDPARAARVRAAAPLDAPVEGAPGAPTIVDRGVLLHARHDPAREGARWAAAQAETLAAADARTAIVLGFGLGYHVEALADRFAGRVVVVEPDDRLLRTALAARDLRAVLARIELAPDPLAPETIDAFEAAVVVAHAPSCLRAGPGLRAVGERIAGRITLATLRLHVLVVSPLGGGSYPMTRHCARALAELGHRVTVLDLAPYAAGMDAIAGFGAKRAARRVLEQAYARFLGTAVVAAVETAAPDVVLAMAQAPLDRGVLDEIGRRGVARAFWFVEDHRLFPYWREVIGGYDHFFAIQQGAFLDEARAVATGTVTYLPCAADPQVHRPLVAGPLERSELGAPVGFVGAGYRNRRIAFRTLLDLGLRVWGTEWQGAGAVERVVERGGARISTEDSVRIFNATDVNLNLHSSTYVDGVDPRGDFVNPRTFELAACGAFQLVDRRALLPPLFEPGVEVVAFDDTGALRDLVRHWVAHPAERAAFAAAARRRALAEHTYRHRMATLLETVCARDHERLRRRPREETVAEAARREGDSALGRFLGTLPAETPCTLPAIVDTLGGREGDLGEAEATFLLLHQFDEMYVKDARA